MENPADGPRWLLRPDDPALPRVFEAIRPLVLPKLREENERAKGPGKKKKSVKDIVIKDEFEVSVFLTEGSAKHALVVKNKAFNEKSDKPLDDPSLVPGDESDDDERDLYDIPEAGDDDDELQTLGTRRRSNFQSVLEDDKKKLGFKTTYEGFAIWGKVLCLLVERKGGPGKKSATSADGGAQALMEEWIGSQQQREEDQLT